MKSFNYLFFFRIFQGNFQLFFSQGGEIPFYLVFFFIGVSYGRFLDKKNSKLSYIIIIDECTGSIYSNARQQRRLRFRSTQVCFYLCRLDFVKKPLVATMSEVPLHLAPPVQEISQENFQPSVEEEVIDVRLY